MVTNRYEPLESLRASLFGEILRCRDMVTQEQVIIKTIDLALAKKQQSRTHERVQEDVLKEIDVLSRVSALGGHPNVIHMHNYYVTPDGKFLHVVLDYCEGGDLLDCAQPATSDDDDTTNEVNNSANEINKQNKPVNENVALAYVRDVLAGLEFLHRNGIAHRDLSLENILVRDGRAVISDFGLCAQQETNEDEAFRCTEIVGKHYYMAPEVVAHESYEPKVADIWSLGVSLFILLTSSPPFESATHQDSGFRYVAKYGIHAVLKAWGFTDKLSDDTQDLLKRMLTIDPAKRITMAELLEHPAIICQIDNAPTSSSSSEEDEDEESLSA